MKTLSDAIRLREFVVTAELSPRKGTIVSNFIKTVHALKDKVHAINITDNQRAVMRMSSLVASYLVLREGVDPVYQITCRDRNRLALQSDLLGASVLGIRNVLALTGDHPSAGDAPEAKPVFDLDATTLLQTIGKLNAGVDLNDHPLKGATSFFAGAALTPQTSPLEPVLLAMERKILAGAQFFQTQPVFDAGAFASFMEKIAAFQVPVMAGILLLHSAEQATSLNAHVPGINIPDALIKRLAASPDPHAEGVDIAAGLIGELKQSAQGVHIMTVGQEKDIHSILERI